MINHEWNNNSRKNKKLLKINGWKLKIKDRKLLDKPKFNDNKLNKNVKDKLKYNVNRV